MKYRVRKINNKYYPERYDKDYDEYLSFDNKDDAYEHINMNPNQLNINCD